MRSLVVLFAVIAAAVAAPKALGKRSIGHAVAYSIPTAVSHQSRVDVHSSPAVVTSVVEPTVVAEPTIVEARAFVAEPVVAGPIAYAAPYYAGASAVSHQSRVDVHSSPALVSEQYVAPAVVDARSIYAPTLYSTW